MLLLDMIQYKVVKGKSLGSVLVKQFSRAQPGWGLLRFFCSSVDIRPWASTRYCRSVMEVAVGLGVGWRGG